MSHGNWYNVFECPCGEYREYAWRDSKFFLDTKICPKCGIHNEKWEQKTIRYNVVKKFWFIPLKREIEYLNVHKAKSDVNKNLDKLMTLIGEN